MHGTMAAMTTLTGKSWFSLCPVSAEALDCEGDAWLSIGPNEEEVGPDPVVVKLEEGLAIETEVPTAANDDVTVEYGIQWSVFEMVVPVMPSVMLLINGISV